MARRALFAFALTALFAAGALQAAPKGRLMRFPDMHGDKIVFTYAGDLWTVSAGGGMARRLTTHPGYENFAKFSPDGETIAFTAFYDGNMDVYTIPAEGGEPKRLTFHPSSDMVLGWHPGGEKILFRSPRDIEGNVDERYNKLYTIGVEGGLPDRLPLFEGELTSFSPDGKKIAYNRISREARTWKRYRGGMAQDIWLYDLEKNEVEKLTDFEGTDAFPMWYRDKIYFASDREHTMNLYCLELDTRKVRKVTNHTEYDVKWPSLGGEAIIYENGGYLYVLDLATEKSKKVPVEIASDRILRRPRIAGVGNRIGGMGISKSGKRAVLEARGDIFTVPAEKGEIRNLTSTPGIRERNPVWSPDGKWIAYISDRTGEYGIYLRKPGLDGEETKLISGSKGWLWRLVWSPDSKKLLYTDDTGTLHYIDIEEKKARKIDKGEYDDINYFSWSPDSKWIAYARVEESNYGSIYLYSLKEGKTHRVTSDFYDDYNPVFDPEGKYLFFFSNRSWYPQISNLEFNFSHVLLSDICIATLQADTPSPLEPESDEEEVAEEEAAEEEAAEDEKKDEGGEAEKNKEEEKPEKEEDEEKKTEEEEEIKIDLEGLEQRIVSLPVPPGNYFGLEANEGNIFYFKVPDQPITGGPPDFSSFAIMTYNLKKREEKNVIAGINRYALSADGKKIIYRAMNTFGIIDAAPGKNVGDGKLPTESLQMKIDPAAEWEQMFNEAWRLERDFFYDPNMHGVDWSKMKKRYGALLPHVAHRADLNYVIGELIAELSVSHSYVGGGEMPAFERVGCGLLCCDLEIDGESGRYRFKKIYAGKNWDASYKSPLTQPGITVKEGDYILSINGTELEYPTNPYELLQNLAGKQTSIRVSADPSGEDAREYKVEPVGSERRIRYADWVDGNRRKIEEATGGKVGYIHLGNTAVFGINEFANSFYPQIRKEGLILDVRYNSGGWVPLFFIERLSRRITSYFSRRNFTSVILPPAAPVGHMACIINAYAGSGGDMFPYYFRQSGLGPLIGKRTWGGLVGINRNIPLMDGGGVTVPAVGFFNLEGKWEVENIGVDPDIEVDNRPDLVVDGRDPQIETAIEYVMKKIEEEPPKLPKRPKYPIKK